ncbi:pyridoxine 5'-phosphate synthase [Litorivicinus lipolyticus]|jgi:pyridoxine 5-phosphate synthase|uniref:Pyridoxine 5'-phosphate synthase n=1 Tax=Litorivicinus lipolyticus TaxID=418701 RepID=A0A5Q2Q946_9GAMM|nr:pyridoxine 5'-phosphate synthase [Litorivicinus lipolyticus]QGG80728.1 pyridoxine 5'-phosphate synthase [Litorivicinus lipolyticus]
MSRVLLGVNIDHIATVRNARGGRFPCPVEAALVAEAHGADGITAHLREDRRHIKDGDIRRLKAEIATRLNFEMAVTDEMVDLACQVQPAYVCLVPEKREELTTEGGLDVVGQFARIQAATARLNDAGIEVSLFIDPNADQLAASRDAGASTVELHTGSYAEGHEGIQVLADAMRTGRDMGLVMNAGHGLDLANVGPVARLDGMHELNIGFAIVGRALTIGLGPAVAEMKAAIDRACGLAG